MTSKTQDFGMLNEYIIPGADHTDKPVDLIRVLTANIRDSFDEIDILRGTVQYWESRQAASDPKERDLLMEAFRIMHGELLGLTVRVKDLLNRAELAMDV